MRSIVVAIAVGLVLPSSASSFEVTSCGAVVPAREVGEVRSDLDCSSIATAVTLEPRATLRLNGFAITVGLLGVSCLGPCAIEGGGGTISGSGAGLAVQHAKGRLTLRDLEIFDLEAGIQSLHRSSVVAATDVVAHDTGFGFIVAGKLEATDVVASDSKTGIAVLGDLVATNLIAANNEFAGVYSRHRVTGSGISVTGNGGDGIHARRVDAANVMASGNQFGIVARRVSLSDSTLTGNATDLAAFKRPALVDVACDTSLRLSSEPPSSWQVCAND